MSAFFPGLPRFDELHALLARWRRRDPDAIPPTDARDIALVLCERIVELEARIHDLEAQA